MVLPLADKAGIGLPSAAFSHKALQVQEGWVYVFICFGFFMCGLIYYSQAPHNQASQRRTSYVKSMHSDHNNYGVLLERQPFYLTR